MRGTETPLLEGTVKSYECHDPGERHSDAQEPEAGLPAGVSGPPVQVWVCPGSSSPGRGPWVSVLLEVATNLT